MGNNTNKLTEFDNKEWYCRMLGHTIAFRYCRTMAEGLPCHRILDCWYEILPIQSFIEQNYSAEERGAISQPPDSRLTIMAKTLNRVEKRKKDDGDNS